MINKQNVISVLETLRDSYIGFFPGSIVEKCIKAVQDIPEDNGWISTKDRLPEEFISVLVYIPGESPLQTVMEGYVVSDMWYTRLAVFSLGEVTHWMPMPNPPKE